MDEADHSHAGAGLGSIDLDGVFDAVREMISDRNAVEGYLKWPAIAALGAIMSEPRLLASAAEVAFDGLRPYTEDGMKAWLLARALFTASTAQAEYEVERGLALPPSDRTRISPRAPEAVRDYISRDERLAVMKFYVMADTELSSIAMAWPAGPEGQYRIGDEGYVTDAQFERVVPDPADQNLYMYLSNGGALTDEIVQDAVSGRSELAGNRNAEILDRDPEAPVFYTESSDDEWDESLDEGYSSADDIEPARAREVPGTKALIAQISRKLGGGTEGAMHASSRDIAGSFRFGQA